MMNNVFNGMDALTMDAPRNGSYVLFDKRMELPVIMELVLLRSAAKNVSYLSVDKAQTVPCELRVMFLVHAPTIKDDPAVRVKAELTPDGLPRAGLSSRARAPLPSRDSRQPGQLCAITGWMATPIDRAASGCS